ncbi:MAG TPA: LysR family transcriptional regulator, partial [Marinobacter hydrocarbonoclasticus]|nr:LysR family transcriptional regulator [Marinobacter nauticus]
METDRLIIMDKLRAMRMFVRVVDAGSFSRVANELNVTT